MRELSLLMSAAKRGILLRLSILARKPNRTSLVSTDNYLVADGSASYGRDPKQGGQR
jgi:hypothetical protein